jgi:hypothetical protein
VSTRFGSPFSRESEPALMKYAFALRVACELSRRDRAQKSDPVQTNPTRFVFRVDVEASLSESETENPYRIGFYI